MAVTRTTSPTSRKSKQAQVKESRKRTQVKAVAKSLKSRSSSPKVAEKSRRAIERGGMPVINAAVRKVEKQEKRNPPKPTKNPSQGITRSQTPTRKGKTVPTTAKGYSPVTVAAGPQARRSGIPVRKAVNQINKAAGTRVAKVIPTAQIARADIKVRTLSAAEKRNYESEHGITPAGYSGVPSSRADIEKGVNVEIAPRMSYKRIATHELGHALGVPHTKNLANKRSVMGYAGGTKVTRYNVRKIGAVTGAPVQPKPERTSKQNRRPRINRSLARKRGKF